MEIARIITANGTIKKPSLDVIKNAIENPKPNVEKIIEKRIKSHLNVIRDEKVRNIFYSPEIFNSFKVVCRERYSTMSDKEIMDENS